MKRCLFLSVAIMATAVMFATDLTGRRIYVNPGHGSYGANDRPMATIPYPNLSSTGMPDTCGFFESNTNLWKSLYLGQRLEAAGATVFYSRTECGPWPYERVNGEFPSYSWDAYKNLPDYEKYNRALSEICEEVEANNIDYFISIHSNANVDGSTANYPLFLYRGEDGKANEGTVGSYDRAEKCWPYRNAIMLSGIDPSSSYKTSTNIRGDVTFMGSGSNSTRSNGKTYYGYYGVLKHGAPGFLVEGYFHTYQPARHRALNKDYCHQEGLAYYRGIVDFYGADKDTKGYIMGTVKDQYRKMSHPLFQYTPKTNDQWIPCNGAEVTLYKGGVEVAKYTVDNNYNGLFVFENLEPGDDYTINASCDGYYPLAEEYKGTISVKANETTYPMVFLVDTSYTPPAVYYTNYPNPAQPEYLNLPSAFEMQQSFIGKPMAEVLDGKTIRRVLYHENSLFILAVDAAKEPTLIEVDADSQIVKDTLPTDFCSFVGYEGMGMKLSDISFTADGYLVGCNYEKVTFEPVNHWQIYKWEKTADGWTGAMWFDNSNNETAGNYYDAMVGLTMAYSGTLEDGILTATTMTTGGSTNMRYVIYTISDGTYSGALRNQPDGVSLNSYGEDMRFVVSPRDTASFIVTSPYHNPIEWKIDNTTKNAPVIVGQAPFHAQGASYFKYAHRSMMVVPAENADSANVGVALYDITDGLDKAQLVKTTNTALDAATPAFAMAAAMVNNTDITLYLVKDNTLSKFTTLGVAQPVYKRVMAYDLNYVYDETLQTYTFSFKTNTEDVVSAELVFSQLGKETGSLPVTVSGRQGQIVVSVADLPLRYTATPAQWGIRLHGNNVADWGKVFEDKSLIASGTSRLFNAVDNSPESPYFGRTYVMHRAGSSSSALKGNSGIFVYDIDFNRLNEERYNGGLTFGNPTRLSVDGEGTLYIADWADSPYSGISIADPSDLTKPFTQFFMGTRNSAGAFSNNGVFTGSSTPGCRIYGSGANTRLVVYNEDGFGKLPTNGIAYYNIGTDSCILHTWSKEPSGVIKLTGQGNTEGNPWPTSHGVFVSQVRGAGNNNASATSLKFYDYAGNELFSSAVDPYKDIIDGSDAGGYVVTPDEATLILNDGSKNFLVFDIEWQGDKPVLTLRYTYKHNILCIRQMNLDFAGNLICTGDESVAVFTLPTSDNTCLTPAKASFTVSKPFSGNVEGVEVDKTDITLIKGKTATIIASVLPEVATEKTVTWTSSNEAVATVSDGVITALASGKTTVTVTTVSGGLMAQVLVTVINPVTALVLDKHDVSLLTGEKDTLLATITPADADNLNVAWSVSDAQILNVNKGVITALAAGSAYVRATSVDGGFRDSCLVTVTDPIINVTGVTLDSTAVTLRFATVSSGETNIDHVVLTATVMPADATNTNISWASDNETVATVTPDNDFTALVQAVSEGIATITVTTEDGNFTASCAVTVETVSGILEVYVLDTNAPMYDVLGRKVTADYKGVIIQNGHKFLNR